MTTEQYTFENGESTTNMNNHTITVSPTSETISKHGSSTEQRRSTSQPITDAATTIQSQITASTRYSTDGIYVTRPKYKTTEERTTNAPTAKGQTMSLATSTERPEDIATTTFISGTPTMKDVVNEESTALPLEPTAERWGNLFHFVKHSI